VRHLAYTLRSVKTDFRKHPQKYRVGRETTTVLLAEPYKSELLDRLAYENYREASRSAQAIFRLFEAYRSKEDFIGMDMAKKVLYVGFVNARREAARQAVVKDSGGQTRPLAPDWMSADKSRAATVFFRYYRRIIRDPKYLNARRRHLVLYG
jgi:hypothetical protein